MESLTTAVELYRRGKLVEAEADCTRILASTPDRCDALALLAELRSSSGRTLAAIEPLSELAALQPRDAANLRRLGSALLSVGKPAEAAEVLARARHGRARQHSRSQQCRSGVPAAGAPAGGRGVFRAHARDGLRLCDRPHEPRRGARAPGSPRARTVALRWPGVFPSHVRGCVGSPRRLAIPLQSGGRCAAEFRPRSAAATP